MAESRFRSYPVIDDKHRVVGSISRYHLITDLKKKIILVDHNERNQSIDDLDSAEILQIVDHHRVANIATASPIYFRNEPVGSTATIVSKMYFENGIVPSKSVAGLLCAAIISDTLLFRSPTSMATDRYILDKMSKIAAIDVEDFAMKMFKAGTGLEGRKPEALLNTDVKNFTFDGRVVRVSQIFTMDLESIASVEGELKAAMEAYLEKEEPSAYVLMITDIFSELSQVIVVGDFKEALARQFGATLEGDKFTAKGLLSRKKQMVPKLGAAVDKSR